VYGTQLAVVRYVAEGGAVRIPEGAVYLYNSAFKDQTAITSVTIPEGVVRLFYDVFSGCANIESVTFPSTLRSIQNKAFYGVTKAAYFDLPDNLSGISGNGGGAHSFEGCTAVLRVKKDSVSAKLLGGEKNYEITFPGEEDFRYRYEKLTVNEETVYRLYLKKYVGTGKEVVIPEGIYGVSFTYADPAFMGQDITKVVIPEGTVVIEDSAFKDCVMLTDITLPSTLKILKNHAFENTGTTPQTRFIVVLPAGLEEMTYQNWGSGWDSFQESFATLVALNKYTRDALYDGWYYYYTSLEDAQNGVNLCYQHNDDPDFKYHGNR
jgi:hypothetical protein